jgi:membrane fusion protein (multidrug efflux system)
MKAKPVIAGIVLLLTLLAIGTGVWWMRHKDDLKAAAQQSPPHVSFVDIATVEASHWQPKARLVGTVFPKRSVTVSNEVTGVVTEVGFDSGVTVEPGQILLKLDSRTEQADLAAAEAAERLAKASVDSATANARVAETNLNLAKSNQRRYADAAAARSVSESEVDRVNAEVDKATADLERERAAIVRAKAELDQATARVLQIRTTIAKKTLTAPFRAQAGMRTIHQGQYIGEGTSIVLLTEVTEDIYLDFAVPQEYASLVTPGMVGRASSNVLGGIVDIKVESMDATVNPSTRNVRVRSVVDNKGQRLKPGMFIEVEMPTALPMPVVVIPTSAVRRAAYGDHVFVLEPGDPKSPMPGSMVAKQRMVTLGVDLDGKVVVTKGLAVGDKIAANGSFKLMDGGMVMQSPPPGAQGQPGAPGAGGPPPSDQSLPSADGKGEAKPAETPAVQADAGKPGTAK